jgi:hypothetical protein
MCHECPEQKLIFNSSPPSAALLLMSAIDSKGAERLVVP